MKQRQIVAMIGALALCFGCTQNKPDASAAGATKPDSTNLAAGTSLSKPDTNKVDTDAPVTPVVPAAIQSDGYHYYGLTRTEPMNYVVTVSNATGDQPSQAAAQSVKFEGMDGDKAKFVIRRTGALEPLGSMHVLVDTKGITIASTSPGTLKGSPLDLPADVKPGTTWKSDYTIDFDKSTAMPEGGSSTAHSTTKIVGVEKVTTKAGTFDALLVESNEDDMLNGKPATIHSQTWYVKDRGPVKMVVATQQAGSQSGTMTIEEAPDTASK